MQLLHSHALGWGKKIKGGRMVRRNTIGCKPALRFSHSHLCYSLEQPWALPQQVVVPRRVVSQQGRWGRACFVLTQGFLDKPWPPLPSHLCWRMGAGTRCSWWEGKDPESGVAVPTEDKRGFLSKRQSLPCDSWVSQGKLWQPAQIFRALPQLPHLFLSCGVSNISQDFGSPTPLKSICGSQTARGPSWIES